MNDKPTDQAGERTRPKPSETEYLARRAFNAGHLAGAAGLDRRAKWHDFVRGLEAEGRIVASQQA